MRYRTTAILVGVFVLLGLMTAAAAAQTITWVSVSADGMSHGGGGHKAVSDDGRFVAFRSGERLVPDDTDSRNDVYVKDVQTGAIERVSVTSTGGQADGASGGETTDISDDGRFVLFDSTATNLVDDDNNGQGDLFIRDRQSDETIRVVPDDGSEGNARRGAISGNGRAVALIGQGFDDGGRGIFVYDIQTGEVTRVTDGVNFLSTNHQRVEISDSGRWVAFITAEFNSNRDVVLFDRDTNTWEIANPRLGGEAPQSRLGDLDLSGNGRFVTFGSPDTNYVAGDPNGTNDVFVYDADAGELERIPGGGSGGTQDTRPVISDSGRYVAFTSGPSDIYGPANGRADVVVFDRQTDVGEVVSIYNDGSAGERGSGSYLNEEAISSDGRFVAFSTPVGFDPDDGGNTSNDVYIVDREGTTGGPQPGECIHDFTDVDSSNTFESDICWLADQGITRGCNPPANTEFCPKDPVTRGQMAAFLVRALGYTDDGGGDLFRDDNNSVFEGDIDRLGTAGVTRGCNPPTNDLFCPNDNVTRGQMAAFLVRALGYTDDGGGDLFRDDNNSVFEGDIDRLGTAGVTRGCNPPTNDLFCPDDDVTREQMAAFLRRALDK